MPYQQINELFQKFFSGTITAEEQEMLNQWITETADEELFEQQMEQAWQRQLPDNSLSSVKADAMLQAILSHGKQRAVTMPQLQKNTGWKRWMAAASITVLFSIAAYWILEKEKKPASSGTTETLANDVKAPERNRASVTLASGEKVYLDSLQQGAVVNEKQGMFTKGSNADIAYKTNSNLHETAETFNTLNNPRGSRIATLTLSDGTKVWLNAGSSITYPVSFTGKERKVEIMGEAYFEVRENASKPFRVQNGSLNITVLGTEFNINANYESGSRYVTLVTGAISVSEGKDLIRLKPGQTAHVGNRVNIETNVDAEDAIAWKSGWFRFSRIPVGVIMQEISRWYDVDVQIEDSLAVKTFSGIISRDSNISELLELMKHAGIKSRIEGRKVFISK